MYPETLLSICDNSGATHAKCIRILNGSKRIKHGSIGDLIVAVVYRSKNPKKVQEHSIVFGLIVRTKKGIRRKDGIILRFGDNAAILLDKDGSPKGTRIVGVVPYDLRQLKLLKTLSVGGSVL